MKSFKRHGVRGFKRSRFNPTLGGKTVAKTLAVITSIGAFAIFIGWVNIMRVSVLPVAEAKAQTVKEMTAKETICEATGGENCDVLYNLCKAESGCKKYAVNKNKNGTMDYSWFQINTIHIKGLGGKNASIDMDCVYDLSCVSKWSNEQIKSGHGNIWTAWKKI